MRRAAGFTLVELVLVMIIISVGLLGLTRTFSITATSLSTNEILQQATQYAQQCAEAAIARRRDSGFTWFASNTFSCGTNPSGFTFNTVSTSGNPLVGSLYSGTGTACPSGTNNCRDISITVTSTTNSSLSSTIKIMLVNY